jgi:hypothetical protein
MKPPSDRTRTSPDDPKKSASRQGDGETGEGADDEEWDPQPAELREGEAPDEDAHARRNAEMLRRAREELGREGEEGPGADE